MILLLDNNDSFVHNLARYFRLTGAETTVVRSHRITASQAIDLRPRAVVLSPGPHGPQQAGCCMEFVQSAPPDLPILGVCLGHQVIGAAFGGQIGQVEPRHGMTSPIEHERSAIFDGCPSPMDVARYHSLAISDENLPDVLRVTATSRDDHVIMGVQHQTRPVFGIQFHPESVLSEFGERVVQNFASLALANL